MVGPPGSGAGGGEQEAVVVAVAVAAGDASVELDDADGFGAAVAGAIGGEVAEVGVFPLAQGASESGYLGDRAGDAGQLSSAAAAIDGERASLD